MTFGARDARASGPHRHPFRFIDRGAGSADDPPRVAVSAGGALFRTASSSLPLTLLIEIMAQGALAALDRDGGDEWGPEGARSLRLAGIDGARSRLPVRPGDLLAVRAGIDGRFGAIIRVACRLERTDGAVVAEAGLMLALA